MTIAEEKKAEFLEAITLPYPKGLLGKPYEEDGCLKFVREALGMLGIEASDDLRREGHNWVEIEDKPEFGDVAVFKGLPFSEYHVALMLDATTAIQSASSTGGVGRIDITRDVWAFALDKIWRRKTMENG